METVSREDRGITVDVVQSYLDSGQCSDALVALFVGGKHDRQVERRAAISPVHRRVDLEVGPLALSSEREAPRKDKKGEKREAKRSVLHIFPLV